MAVAAKRILLVNTQANRRVELARRLEQAGYEVTPAEDGALAINRAVIEPPDMIITLADMPLLDGFKLCQLLRTNPATRHVPFVFITDKATNPKKLGQFIRPDDDFILQPFRMEELLGRVHNLFYRMDKVQEVSAEADRSVGGTLSEIALVDLLQIFKMNRKSGFLTLKGENQTGVVFLRDGGVVDGRLGKVTGEKAMYRLLTWQQGTFEFKPAVVDAEERVHMGTENLIMEGLRQLDEMVRIDPRLQNRRSVLRLKKKFRGPVSKLKPVTAEVLGLLEYFSRVDELLDNSAYPDLEVLITLQALLEHDIVEVREETAGGVPKSRNPLLTLEEALKIGYYLGVGRGEPNQQWVGKVLLFAQDSSCLEAFVERAEVFPEFALEDHSPPGDWERNFSTGVKATITIMENITLLMLYLPPVTGCEPLWRVFHHRAIGALFLGRGNAAANEMFTPVAGFLKSVGIPFAPVALEAPSQTAAAGLPWRAIDPSEDEFAGKALRALFESILVR